MSLKPVSSKPMWISEASNSWVLAEGWQFQQSNGKTRKWKSHLKNEKLP